MIFCPRPLADGVNTSSGVPDRSVMRVASIMALMTKALPVSRWHQLQWQQCTIIGALVSR